MQALSGPSFYARMLLFAFFFVTPLANSQTVDAYLVSDFDVGNVQIFSFATNQLLKTIQTGPSPQSALISPDGRRAYVPNLNSTYLSVLDLTIGAEIVRIPEVIDLASSSLVGAITPDGSKVLVSSGPGQLSIINTSDFSISRISLGTVCDDTVPANCDSDPNDLHILGIATVGTKAYLNLLTSFAVRIVCIDLNTLTLATVPGTAVGVDASVNSIVVSPDSRFVIAKRNGPRALLVIDTGTNTVVQRVTPDILPRQLVATTPGSASGGVFVYLLGTDFTTNEVVIEAYAFSAGILNLVGSVSLFPLENSLRIAISPDSSELYVGAGTTVTVLNTQAIINNPPTAVVGQFAVANLITGMAAGSIQLQPPSTAPTVTGVAPNLVLSNDTDAGRTIQVSGTNFSPDALLRIGNLVPLAPGINTSGLQAVVPAGAPAQVANIIVTDPNLASAIEKQNQSGILRGQFIIASPPTFQPVNQAVVANFGNGTAAVLNVSTNVSLQPVLPGALGATGVAIAPGGERAYIGQFVPPAVHVFNLVQNQAEATIQLEGGVIGQTDGVVVAPISPFGGPVVYAVATHPLSDGNADEELFVIDADPAHAGSTLNSVLVTLSAGQDLPFGYSGAVGATPDGRYVYTNALQDFLCSVGWLMIFDVVSGSVNTIPASTFNLNACQLHIEVTPDGKSLLLNSADGRILVFDISVEPMNPTQVAVIAPQTPVHFSSSSIPTLRVPVGTPNVLYAFDPTQNVVAAFNFDRVTPNFSQLGSVNIPGPGAIIGGSSMNVTPDGKLLYVPLNSEDDVAVLDAALVANSDPAAVITKIFSGLGPGAVAVRPGTPTPVTTSTNPVVNVVLTQGIAISFSDVTSAGATTVTTTNTTPFSAPAGFQISGVPVYYEVATTARFSSAVACFQYDPAGLPSPETSLRLAHYNRSIDPVTNQVIGWEDVTIPGSPDSATHTICGQVSTFSPFVIGIASVDFLFNSLLVDIGTLSAAVTPPGVMRSLRAKALAARASVHKGNNTSAENQLNALINQLQAIAGKQVSSTDANKLISESQAILSHI
jgi:WD40 repeat protein